jgi:anaerobic selenocysteine-containing dehydrogenase
MKTVASVCPLDCPDTCSLSVEVGDQRVASVDGSELNPLTGGFICAKVRRFPEIVHGEGRVLRPARRVGAKGEGGFEEISWDEALDLLSERIAAARASHPESILPLTYGGSNGNLTHGALDERLFRRLGASRLARTICAAPSGAASAGLYGNMPGVSLEDYEHAQLIVLWGVNPKASGIHLLPKLKAAQARGARLVVVDPRRTQLARQADLHLGLRPGTDLPLALAVIRALFAEGKADEAFLAEHCLGEEVASLRTRAAPWTLERAAETAGVALADLRRLVDLYAETSPTLIRCGWGLERNRNGGSAVAAVLALPAVAGKFGVRAGGYTMSNDGAWSLDKARAIAAPEPATRLINMNRVGRALTEPDAPEFVASDGSTVPVSLVVSYNANPLTTFPDQERVRRGLLREDLFHCAFEQVWTDTARCADLVLPATTFLEHDELRRGYGALVALRARPAIAPVGEARTNLSVFGELIERLGLAQEGDPTSPDELVEALLGKELAAKLDEEGRLFPECGRTPVQMVDTRPLTTDGKIHLFPGELEAEAPEGLYVYREPQVLQRFPLNLISPASQRAISSTLFQLHEKQVPLEMSPEDAQARGLSEGQAVRVFNDLGEVRTSLRVTDEVRPGVVCLPKGLWAKHTANGASSNALSPDTLTDLGGGACFNDARVEVEAA